MATEGRDVLSWSCRHRQRGPHLEGEGLLAALSEFEAVREAERQADRCEPGGPEPIPLEVMGDRRMLAHWAQPAGTGMTDDRAKTFLSQP